MAAVKCETCKRWTLENGCSIEAASYSRYKACMLDRMNFYIPKNEQAENRAELRRQIEEEKR